MALNAPVGCVIRNAFEDLGQYDAAQGEILVIEDALLQRGDLRQMTISEEVDPDAGVDQNR